jgi:hypothetical protein
MNWTTDKPKQTGFYWYKAHPHLPGGIAPPITVVEVIICQDSFVAKLAEEGDNDLEKFNGEWMGPLEIPT